MLTSKNGMHLTGIFSPLNLTLGTIMHKSYQLWLENPETPLQTHVISASYESQIGIKKRYKKQVGVNPSDEEMLVTHEAIEMALAMAEMYATRWGQPLPDEYKLLRAEQKISVAVPGTEHPCDNCGNRGCEKCGGLGYLMHHLEGRLDGLIQHQSGRIDILEHKTYGQRPKEDDMRTNDQFTAYIWLVKQLQFNEHLDSLIAYDGMWRRASVPRGRTFNDLFSRYTISRSPHELAEFERFLALELNDMAALYAAPEKAYKNVPWSGCWDCKVHALCVTMSRGEDTSGLIGTQFTTRTDDLEEEENVDTAD